MRKVWLIFKREYLVRVRTKGFIFTTVALPAFSAFVLILVSLMATRESDHPLKIALLDDAGLSKNIAAGFSEKLKNGQPLFQLVRTIENPPSEQAARDELAEEVRRGALDGYVVVPRQVLERKPVEFHTQNAGDFQAPASMRRAVDRAVISQRLSNLGVRVDNLSDLVRGADFTLVKVGKVGEAVEKGQTFIVAFAVAFVLYFTLLLYGVATMRSVLEEKTTRVVEILASSARPFDLMAGKILGVAGSGFTQYLIWGATGLLISTYGAAAVSAFRPGAPAFRLHIPVSLLIYGVLFFLAGYFLYASIYAAVGAMVSSDEEAQQLQIPMTLLIVVAFMLYPAVMRDPSSRLSVIISLVPFFSPILMVFRIGLQTPPLWQIILSLVLCIATTIGVVRVASKIYRVGILMYGKRPSLVELLRWMKYT
jgi:ABC-2 type transport system permease protein